MIKADKLKIKPKKNQNKITFILEGDQGRKTQNKTKKNQNNIIYTLEGDLGRKTRNKSKIKLPTY